MFTNILYLPLKIHSMRRLVLNLLFMTSVLVSLAQKPRARDLGIPFDGVPGKNNAITDVAGVEVGYSTIISGQGKNVLGKGPLIPSIVSAATMALMIDSSTASTVA